MNFETLECAVIRWASDNFILTQSSYVNQLEKLEEEFNELYDAFLLKDKVDAIGDMVVVLIILAWFSKIDLTKCLSVAYEEIKDRKGKIVDGIFVKEENNELTTRSHVKEL